jgi:aspartyl-tRNA(Asn)/glutamyl-tRNA(Gln) amidotransferase subunit C
LPIDSQEVLRIAALAHLELDAESVETFRDQLQQILEYVAVLGELDVDATEPTHHPIGRGQVLRADAVTACLSREETLGNAPDAAAGLFRVPRVLQG